MKNMRINNIIIGNQVEKNKNLNEFINIAKHKNIKVTIVNRGDCIKVENELYIDILWPDKHNIILNNAINNNALVFKLIDKKVSILFTGDIEKETEEQLSQIYNGTEKLQANILKVAHHGSNSSSTEKFLNMIKPKFALIGVGKNNLYGHPSAKTIENLKKMGITIFRTDINGEININIAQNGKVDIWKMIN